MNNEMTAVHRALIAERVGSEMMTDSAGGGDMIEIGTLPEDDEDGSALAARLARSIDRPIVGTAIVEIHPGGGIYLVFAKDAAEVEAAA